MFGSGRANQFDPLYGNEPRLQIEDLILRQGNGTVTLAGSFGKRLEFRPEAFGIVQARGSHLAQGGVVLGENKRAAASGQQSSAVGEPTERTHRLASGGPGRNSQ